MRCTVRLLNTNKAKEFYLLVGSLPNLQIVSGKISNEITVDASKRTLSEIELALGSEAIDFRYHEDRVLLKAAS